MRRAGRIALLALGLMAGPLAAPADEAGCRSERQSRLAEALRSGYGIQYWGEGFTPAELAARPHGLLILELTRWGKGLEDRFGPADLARISRAGERPVLAYLNVAEVEPFRDYMPDPDAPRPDWWGEIRGDEHLAAYWTDAWAAVLHERVDALMARGADGLFLDDVLHYYTHMADDDGVDHPQAMMRLVLDLAERARSHDCRALVIVNNAVFVGRDAGPPGAALFERYRGAIDAVLVENAVADAGATATRTALAEDYAATGLPVLSVDVAEAPDRAAAVADALAAGFLPYVIAENSFSRLYPPVTPR